MKKAEIEARLKEITGIFEVKSIKEGIALSKEKWKLIAMAPSLVSAYRSKHCGICNIVIEQSSDEYVYPIYMYRQCKKCPVACTCILLINTRADIAEFRTLLHKACDLWEQSL